MNDHRLWKLTDHVCRHCLGRVLVTENHNGSKTARCSNCGAEAQGDHKALCTCGLKLRNNRSAGLRCVPNPNPTTEMPSEIVASAV